MSLKIDIANMQKEIQEKVPFINSGDYIQFAYFFSKKLTSLNIKHKIVFTDRYCKINEYTACNHIGILIYNIGVVDGEKTFPTIGHFNRTHYKSFPIDHKKLNDLRLDKLIWNNMYDTRQNSLLSKIINKHINDYRRK